MTILAWNCQGSNLSSSIQHLKGLVSLHKPSILFLSETLANEQHMRRLSQTLQFNNYFTVAKIGRQGGLCLMWKDNLNIQIVFHPQNYIHTKVTPPPPNQPWYCTGIHDPPHPDTRKIFWQEFPTIFNNINPSIPWLLLGDYNDVLDQSEKKGGRQVTYAQTQPLLNLMDQMGFIDLGF